MSISSSSPCPCGSALAYQECCQRLHLGQPAPSAEALMRSRYSAFALQLNDYLISSWHPETRPQQLELEATTVWQRLEIVAAHNDQHSGEVHFKATYCENGQWWVLQEKSQFRYQDNHWFYHSGDYQPHRLDPKRNDPCPCGSAKKYKKCCLS